MAFSGRSERVKIGPRLFKVADRFFIRVPIPRPLREAYKATGESPWEKFEPLRDDAGNPATDRREAEHLCRRRGAEIDAEFKRKRILLEQAKRTQRPLTRPDVERIALRWFNREAYRWALLDLNPQPFQGPALDKAISGAIAMLGRPVDADLKERVKGQLTSDPRGEAAHDGLRLFEAVLREALSKNDFSVIAGALDTVLRMENLTADPASLEYRMLAQMLLRGLLENVGQQQKRLQGDYAGTKADPIFNKLPAEAPADGISLEQLIKQYRRDRGANWSRKTQDGYTVIFRALEELLGKDKGVKKITREDCRRVRDVIADLPPNYTKRPETRGKPILEAAKIARDLALPRLAPKTVNSYLNNLAALFNFAVEEEYVDRHPAKKLQVAVVTKKKDAKKPFDTGQLKAIFNAPLYTGCIDDESGYAKVGPNVPRRGRFWVPLLSLWTGMRLNECCQLLVDDVRYMGKVPVIIISEDAEDGVDDKRVKTEAGERYVPVHPELERIGFLKHWQAMKKRGERRLFSDLPKGANGYYSDPFSQWFRRFFAAAGAKKPKTSFHSFRHNYRDALREADISAERVKALGGWANTEVQEDYGGGLKPETLYREIKKVKFEGLSLRHLHVKE